MFVSLHWHDWTANCVNPSPTAHKNTHTVHTCTSPPPTTIPWFSKQQGCHTYGDISPQFWVNGLIWLALHVIFSHLTVCFLPQQILVFRFVHPPLWVLIVNGCHSISLPLYVFTRFKMPDLQSHVWRMCSSVGTCAVTCFILRKRDFFYYVQ